MEASFQDLENLEHSKPTKRSINLRTFAESTNAVSISLACSIASWTEVSVISLNVTLFCVGNLANIILNLQAMNSPSLSGSVAMYTSSTFDDFAFFSKSVIFFCAPDVQPHGGSGSTRDQLSDAGDVVDCACHEIADWEITIKIWPLALQMRIQTVAKIEGYVDADSPDQNTTDNGDNDLRDHTKGYRQGDRADEVREHLIIVIVLRCIG